MTCDRASVLSADSSNSNILIPVDTTIFALSLKETRKICTSCAKHVIFMNLG